ncbi:hypothetical protein F4776DRAFT_671631 [Hypoxylon sp. NC0597]|nr:hypothetical protein F4776DRAFT_671631 [Hypoxylon sp. NC0597]
MAPEKRQKWVDVYDPATGHHKPRSEVDGQLPDRDATTTKSPDQIQEKGLTDVIEQPQHGGSLSAQAGEVASDQATASENQDQSRLKIGLWRSRWAPEEMVQQGTSIQQQQQNPQPPVFTSESDQGYFSKERSSSALSGHDKGKGKTVEREYTYEGPHCEKGAAASHINAASPYQQSKTGEAVEQVRNTGVEYVEMGVTSLDHFHHMYPRSERDFRHEVPAEIWTEEDWNATRFDKKNNEKQYSDAETVSSAIYVGISSYLERYVKHWVQTTPQTLVDLSPEGVEEPETRDVHPEHGVLMDPVHYPPTKRVLGCPRGINLNAQICIDRKMREIAEQVARDAAREARDLEAAKKTKEDEKVDKGKKPEAVETVEVDKHDNVKKPKKDKDLQATKKAEQSQNRADLREIRINCHLRAASREDMEQVAEIYNQEVEVSYKLPDKRPVSLEKFVQIYHGCLAHNLPFLVAVNGKAGVRTKDQRVIGFVMMDLATRGIFGSYATHAAPCGKLILVVHRNFRRRNVCSAMLDAVFTCCSPDYESRRGYEIVNPNKDRRHLVPKDNSRKWNFIEIEVVVPSGPSKQATKDSNEFKWISNYLQNYFQMQLVYHDEKLFRDERFDNTWLDRLTFRHQCRPLGS